MAVMVRSGSTSWRIREYCGGCRRRSRFYPRSAGHCGKHRQLGHHGGNTVSPREIVERVKSCNCDLCHGLEADPAFPSCCLLSLTVRLVRLWLTFPSTPALEVRRNKTFG